MRRSVSKLMIDGRTKTITRVQKIGQHLIGRKEKAN